MPQERMVIAQRRDTASLARDTGRTTTRLPDDLLTEQVRRIGLFGAVIGGLWTLGVFIDTVMAPLVWGSSMSMRAIWLEVTGIAAAALMVWYVRFCGHSPQRKTNVSLGYLVFNGMGVAVLNTWIFPPVQAQVVHLSWVTVGILVFSMICACLAPQDADYRADYSVDGPAGLLDRVSGRSSSRLAATCRRARDAELRVRDDRSAAFARAAARRTPAARSAGAGQL